MLPELMGNWGNMVPSVWPVSARGLVLGLRLVSAPLPHPHLSSALSRVVLRQGWSSLLLALLFLGLRAHYNTGKVSSIDV